MDMCPAAEIERRTRIEDIAIFERIDARVATTTIDLAVKKFARNVRLPRSHLFTGKNLPDGDVKFC